MEVNTEVWICDERSVWYRGKIVAKELNLIDVQPLGSDEVKRIDSSTDKVHVCNTFQPDDEITSVNDLIKLNHLHEPAILHSLEARFAQDIIYTATGPILLAVNPFKPLPIYDDTRQYQAEGRKKANGLSYNDMPPHVFALADSAYHNMTFNPSGGGERTNQSILVSGESGAGKTETTKFIMRYIATIAGSVKAISTEQGQSIEQKVLESNPILEAFGNARTTRNDNSSRFGKYIKLQFNKRLRIVGASLTTYLLEKARIVNQAADERNYHIFYEMIKGATQTQKKSWVLPEMTSIGFMNQSGCYDKRKRGPDDDDIGFELTRSAMSTMGMPEEEQALIFGIVAAVIHLSAITFQESGNESSAESSSIAPGAEKSSAHVARMLGVEQSALTTILTTRKIKAGHEKETEIGVTADKALGMRDGLAKALYSQLFEAIVQRVNGTIRQDHRDVSCFVGILDIFGFEIFAHNGFEQLCINYANETLQQHFNQFVFRMEQEEYEREQIQWSFIDFEDNQPCLDLVEGRPKGLIALMDEVCLFPQVPGYLL
jgi:myosin-5